LRAANNSMMSPNLSTMILRANLVKTIVYHTGDDSPVFLIRYKNT
jgi:hypothetical protein